MSEDTENVKNITEFIRFGGARGLAFYRYPAGGMKFAAILDKELELTYDFSAEEEAALKAFLDARIFDEPRA